MVNELLQWIVNTCLLLTALTLVILLLRRPMRHWFGAAIAYQAWMILPVALLANALPNIAVVEKISLVAQPIAQLVNLATPALQTGESPVPIFVLILWLSGCLAGAVLFWRQHRLYLRKLGSVKQIQEIYQAQAQDIGPALLGVWRTKIIVPSDFFLRYTAEEQQLIIAHEKIHAKRGDAFANLICAFAQCFFWFNPLMHVAANCFRVDQELACDAGVIAQNPRSRRAYAEAMLKTQMTEPRSAIGCQLQSHQPLKERIMQLHQARPDKTKRSLGKFVLSSLIGLCAYSAWAVSPTTVQDAVKLQAPAASQVQAASGNTKMYRVKTGIKVDGVEVSPSTVSKEGDAAQILIDGKSAKWEIAYTLHSAKAKDGLESVMFELSVKKDGKVVALPKLQTGLNIRAALQLKNSAHDENDFEISLQPSLVN